MRIGKHGVGAGRTYIVAECGLNHNADRDTMAHMINEAFKDGADAVKFSAYHAREFCSDSAEWKGERQVDMFSRYQLTDEDLAFIADHAQAIGIDWFATAQDIRSARLLVKLGAVAIKVGSDDLTHTPLLRQLGELCERSGLPLILSTGMANDEEVAQASQDVMFDVDSGDLDLVLLHCVSMYPTQRHEANVRRVESLHDNLLLPVGYSDHTQGHTAAVAAVACGAILVEKHFTLDRSMPGPDHSFSVDPIEFRAMVDAIREVEQVLGSGEFEPSAREAAMRVTARRSIRAACDLVQGTILDEDMLEYKRPGYGLPPSAVDDVVGCRLVCDVPREGLIVPDMLEGYN